MELNGKIFWYLGGKVSTENLANTYLLRVQWIRWLKGKIIEKYFILMIFWQIINTMFISKHQN